LFRQMAQERVPADEQFFHKYFKFLEARCGSQGKKKSSADESDASSVSDEEFDEYLHKYEKGLIPSGPDLDEEDEIEFDNADFSDVSSEPDEPPGSDDEAMFSASTEGGNAMGGLQDWMPIFESGQMEALCNQMETSQKLDSLFASAEEVGELYRVQETARERKQRLWEEKRSEDTSFRSKSGRRGRRSRGGAGSVGSARPRKSHHAPKTDRKQFKAHGGGGKRGGRRN
uniref:HipN domain-containing protein n=1 Tax=Echinostoma caproni TaxID=27848 RepID=A0A183AMM1_9TREM